MRAARVVKVHSNGGISRDLAVVEVGQPVADLAGIAVVRIELAEDRAKLGGVAEPESEIGGARSDPERIVAELARGAELVAGESVVDAIGEAAVESRGPVIGRERASIVDQGAVRHPGFDIAAAAEELDYGARSFGAEQRAFRAADHFHTFQS